MYQPTNYLSRRVGLAHRQRVAKNDPVVSTDLPSVLVAAAGVNEQLLCDGTGAMCAFVGVVPIRVKGKVKAGSALIPTGLSDGCAVMETSRLAPLNHSFASLGVAMEDTPPDALDRIDCEYRIDCLIHPQYSQSRPLAGNAKPAEAIETTVKRSKVSFSERTGNQGYHSSLRSSWCSSQLVSLILLCSLLRSSQVVPTSEHLSNTFIEVEHHNSLINFVENEISVENENEDEDEEMALDAGPILLSAEFHRLEKVNRNRPWFLPFIMALTYVNIALSMCSGSKVPNDIEDVADPQVFKLARSQIWEKNKISLYLYGSSGIAAFVYQLLWCNFDLISMMKKVKTNVAFRDALSNQILLANAATTMAVLAMILAVCACLCQCYVAKTQFLRGFSAWTENNKFKTDGQHWYALAGLIFLHFLWVLLVNEAFRTARELKMVCKKLLSDSKARKVFKSVAHAHAIKCTENYLACVKRAFFLSPLMFTAIVLISIGFYNGLTIAVLAPTLAMATKEDLWLGNNSFNLFEWSDMSKMFHEGKGYEFSNERSRGSERSSARGTEVPSQRLSQKSSSHGGGEGQSEVEQSTSGGAVAQLDNFAAKFFPGWKLVLTAALFNCLNHALEISFCWHYTTLFFTCAHSKLSKEEELYVGIHCQFFETGDSNTLIDVRDHLISLGYKGVSLDAICQANSFILYDHFGGECLATATLPACNEVKLPGTCAEFPLPVIEQCIFFASRDRLIHFLWHAVTYVLLTYAVYHLLLERRMTRSQTEGDRAKRYMSSTEAFLSVFCPFIIVSYLNTDTIKRELSQSFLLEYTKADERSSSQAQTEPSTFWLEDCSSSSGSRASKRRKFIGHQLGLVLSNRLKFFATMFATLSMLLVTFCLAKALLHRVELSAFESHRCQGCHDIGILSGGLIFNPFLRQ